MICCDKTKARFIQIWKTALPLGKVPLNLFHLYWIEYKILILTMNSFVGKLLKFITAIYSQLEN